MTNVYAFADREAIEAEAREWLIKIDGEDELNTQDRRALQDWVALSPAHRQELERISAFWSEANVLTELAIPLNHPSPQQKAASGLFSRLVTGLLGFNRAGAALAMCVLGIGIAISVWLAPQSQPQILANGVYATTVGEIQLQTLADGSVMHVNTDSQVQVEYSDSLRKIHLLKGEALFEVAKNPDWPFEVYAGGGMVKAVGTAFSVRLDQDDIEVIVTEGQVDLATQVQHVEPGSSQDDRLVPNASLAKIGSLERGQSATFSQRPADASSSADRHLKDGGGLLEVKTLPEKELSRQLAWRDGYLVFSGDALVDVIDEVNRYTTTVVEIADPALRDLRIGGRFKVGQLEALYEVLEASFGIQVSRLDDQYIQLRSAR